MKSLKILVLISYCYIFYNLVKTKIANRDPDEEIIKAFQLFDDDNKGRITVKV